MDYRRITGYKAKLAERISAVDPNLAAQLRNIQLPWYTIRNAEPAPPSEDEPEEVGAEVFIYDEIGGSFGVSADEFVQDLQNIDADNIDVRINSPGGSVFDAIAIYNALVKHPANVTTYVDALAASAASIIAMAGDQCVMMVGSQMMIHDALGAELGNAAMMREMADFLDRQSDNIASIYTNRAGGEVSDWRNRMLAETWLFADEAVAIGLADSVYTRAAQRAAEEAEEETEEGDKPEMEDPTQPVPEPEEDDPDDAIEALMHARHRLTNRGYKYTGRRKAPSPLAASVTTRKRSTLARYEPQEIEFDVDRIIAVLSNSLGR
jgi:ATP-dependent protease ClpP protease subunit